MTFAEQKHWNSPPCPGCEKLNRIDIDEFEGIKIVHCSCGLIYVAKWTSDLHIETSATTFREKKIDPKYHR